MTSELFASLQYLFTQPMFLRMIVVIAVTTVFGAAYFVAERWSKINPRKSGAVETRNTPRRTVIELSGQAR